MVACKTANDSANCVAPFIVPLLSVCQRPGPVPMSAGHLAGSLISLALPVFAYLNGRHFLLVILNILLKTHARNIDTRPPVPSVFEYSRTFFNYRFEFRASETCFAMHAHSIAALVQR